MKIKLIFFYLCALIMMTTTISCANKEGFETPNETANKPPDSDSKEITGITVPDNRTYPLLWESVRTDGKKWSAHVFNLIQQQTPNLIQGAADMATFCPRYPQLTTIERVNFWGLLVSAMAKYESGFDPTNRMHETTMGTDPVTGRPVYSEGLLQLSYQDSRAYPFCDEFNWSVDKNLQPTNPNKTILDPYKNLTCGMKILAQQIKNRNRITLTSGVYWSVIKVGGKYSKIAQIAALTKKMPGCMN
jgi:hypothetical protein